MALESLAPAVLHAILSLLETRALGRVGCVSIKLRDATRDSLLWFGTGRIDDDIAVCRWRAEAFDVYGRYVTTLEDTDTTEMACTRLGEVLRQLTRVYAPLSAVTISARMLPTLRHYALRLTELRTVTVVGAPPGVPPVKFCRPVLPVVLIADPYPSSMVPTWPAFYETVATYMTVYTARRYAEIVYTDNPTWTLGDVVARAADTTSIATIFVSYMQRECDRVVVAERLLAALGDRMRNPQFPQVTVRFFADTPLLLSRILARTPDGAVACVATVPHEFTTRRT
jgi:hypothetical protein